MEARVYKTQSRIVAKLFLAIIFSALTSSRICAQAYLAVDTLIGFDTIVTSPSVDTYRAIIKNVGNQTYTGTFVLHYSVTDGHDTSITWSDQNITFGPVNLLPSDTVGVTVIDSINASTYKGGSSAVVIWPVNYPSGARWMPRHIDSLSMSATKFLLTLTSLLIYPNPFTTDIIFKNEVVKSISLLTIEGKKIPCVVYDGRLSPPADLRKGLYIIEWIDLEGKTHASKVLKE